MKADDAKIYSLGMIFSVNSVVFYEYKVAVCQRLAS